MIHFSLIGVLSVSIFKNHFRIYNLFCFKIKFISYSYIYSANRNICFIYFNWKFLIDSKNSYCNTTWDSASCWYSTIAGNLAVIPCFSEFKGVPYDTSRKWITQILPIEWHDCYKEPLDKSLRLKHIDLDLLMVGPREAIIISINIFN